MARYILTKTIAGAPLNGCYGMYYRGTAIADTAANALPGDLIWPQLTAAPNPANTRPLDALASAVMGLPIVTLADLAAGAFAGSATGI